MLISMKMPREIRVCLTGIATSNNHQDKGNLIFMAFFHVPLLFDFFQGNLGSILNYLFLLLFHPYCHHPLLGLNFDCPRILNSL